MDKERSIKSSADEGRDVKPRIEKMWTDAAAAADHEKQMYIARLAFQAELAARAGGEMVDWMDRYNVPFRDALREDPALIDRIIANHDRPAFQDEIQTMLDNRLKKEAH